MRLLPALPLLLLTACAARSRQEAQAQSTRPPRPAGCAFDYFEEPGTQGRPGLPSRPFEVLVTLEPELGGVHRDARHNMLAGTACQSGADAVLVGRPWERRVGSRTIARYAVRFVAYTDVEAPVDPNAPAQEAPPEDEPGVLRVPDLGLGGAVDGVHTPATPRR